MWQSLAEFRALTSEEGVQKKRQNLQQNTMAFRAFSWASDHNNDSTSASFHSFDA